MDFVDLDMCAFGLGPPDAPGTFYRHATRVVFPRHEPLRQALLRVCPGVGPGHQHVPLKGNRAGVPVSRCTEAGVYAQDFVTTVVRVLCASLQVGRGGPGFLPRDVRAGGRREDELGGSEDGEGTEEAEGTEDAEGTEGAEGTEEAEGTEDAEGTEGAEGTEDAEGAEDVEGTEDAEGTEGAEGTEDAEGRGRVREGEASEHRARSRSRGSGSRAATETTFQTPLDTEHLEWHRRFTEVLWEARERRAMAEDDGLGGDKIFAKDLRRRTMSVRCELDEIEKKELVKSRPVSR